MKPDPAGWNVGLGEVPPKLIEARGRRQADLIRARADVGPGYGGGAVTIGNTDATDSLWEGELGKQRKELEKNSIYREIAENKFGQKIFGLRRSQPEIQRDVAYTTLLEEQELGIEPALRTDVKIGKQVYTDPYEFIQDWYKVHGPKREAALGGAENLTQFTLEDTDRMSSLGEDISEVLPDISGALTDAGDWIRENFKKGGKVSKKKKVSRSYKPKSTKKQYAKNNSVRKPKRI